MNTETGEIVDAAYAAEQNKKQPGKYIPMEVAPTDKQNRLKKVGRNEPCPCGSGKKFKHCHLNGKRPPVVMVESDTAPETGIRIMDPRAVARIGNLPVMAPIWCPPDIREEVKRRLVAAGQTLAPANVE